MIIRPLDTSIARLLHAPEKEASSPAGPTPGSAATAPTSPAPPPKPETTKVAVRAKDSPTRSDIPKAPPREKKEPQIVQAQPKKGTIVDVQKAFGLSKSPSEMNREEGQRMTDKSTAKVVPVPKIKPVVVAAAEPEGDEPEIQPTIERQELGEAEAPKIKVNIGGKEEELTQEELQARISELTAPKEATPRLGAPEAKVEDIKKTPEQIAADEAAAAESERIEDEKFLDQLSQGYTPDPKELDIILGGGKEAVKMFGKVLAKTEYNARKFAAGAANQIYEQFRPALEHFTLIQGYQNDAAMIQEHPDLKDHMATVKDVEKSLQTRFSNELAAMSPKDRRDEIAIHTRRFIKRYGIGAKVAETPVADGGQPTTPVAKPAAPKPKPKPPTGNVGSGRGPTLGNDQANMVQRLIAAGH